VAAILRTDARFVLVSCQVSSALEDVGTKLSLLVLQFSNLASYISELVN
jgi:hypothetical protein